ncbi:proline dehydrogenase 1, mitochondrial-like isoform X2 [Stegodyphus dumicola]|uniref:proline dehydrogenase 1, mitochondrial-like isoform X2 n=1 Tax=Stegodyphus dumicola TaxID=202533 RepID=UPI0015AFA778|nr:proline dehydrogenase 1, mitochondrial-like isoform X2 [Stegodyphus dumicola]
MILFLSSTNIERNFYGMAVTLIAWRTLIIHNNSCKISKVKELYSRLKFTIDVSRSFALNSRNKASSSPQRDSLDLTFENTKDAFKSKTTWELIRGLFVLKLSTYDYLVENHEKLMMQGKKILGPKLFKIIMRHTFYGHFVAGEDTEAIKPVLDRLRSFGVKSILDYSAEEDMSEEQAKEAMHRASLSHQSGDTKSVDLKKYKPYEEFADRRKYYAKARTYFYLSEAQCEKNMETFLKCIDAVAGTTQSTGFAAIKLTALGRPQLLMQLSEVIARTRLYFKEVTGSSEHMAAENVTPTVIASKLEYHKIKTDNEEVKKWLENMDYDRKGLMNMFSWSGLVDLNYVMSDLFKVPNLQSGKMERLIAALSAEEEEMFKNMMRRLHNIARTAREKDVRVMIDAEQSYFQPAINRITMEMMRKYNKKKAIIFNTYQCYLKDAYDSVVLDLELARRQGFYFGAKLVRGAYMEQERIRAREIGYEDPINPTYEATSEMYHKTLSEILRQIDNDIRAGKEKKIGVMVATHNENTIRFAVEKMKELGIQPDHKVVCFGQLFGMCDQVSFLLGQAGYSVYKYVPYGPIEEVLPYLSRRALENHSLLKKVDKEIRLLKTELKRRFLCGQLFYKPRGNYLPV